MPTIEVAEAVLGQLVADLVGERARRDTRPTLPSLKNWAGMIPTLALPRREDAGAVGPDQARRAAPQVVVDEQLVVRRDALGDRDDQGVPASSASRIESAAKRGGTKIIAVFAPVCATAS